MIIHEHYVPSFKPSKAFVEKIKNSESLRARLEEERKSQEQNANV